MKRYSTAATSKNFLEVAFLVAL